MKLERHRTITRATALCIALGQGCSAQGDPDHADTGTTEATGGAGTDDTAATTVEPGDTGPGEDDSDGSQGSTSHDDSSDTSDDGDTTGEPGGPAAIGGEVGRAVSTSPWPGNDGIGTVYLAVFVDTCGGRSISGTAIPDADLSDPSHRVPYLIPEVPPGTYYVGGFMDDNGDADPSAPAPNQGDIVLADGLSPGCVEVELVGHDVLDADVLFNLTLPFDP